MLHSGGRESCEDGHPDTHPAQVLREFERTDHPAPALRGESIRNEKDVHEDVERLDLQ